MALSDAACGALAVEMPGATRHTMIINPKTGHSATLPGIWTVTFDEEGNGIAEPLNAADDVEAIWLVELLPDSSVAVDSSQELHTFGPDGEQMPLKLLEELHTTRFKTVPLPTSEADQQNDSMVVTTYMFHVPRKGMKLFWEMRHIQDC